jgi:hypothetical protein
MCLPISRENRRARAFLCIGMFCLAFSVTMQNFHLIGSGPRDFVRGLLLGIAIAMNFGAAMLKAGQRRNTPA